MRGLVPGLLANDRVIYVIGHRHPDADSICSAIAYAHLKTCVGEPDVRPARAGPVDPETSFVLRTFGVPAPELLTDATGLQLILVDHNEVGQALANIERADIVEVWEHHRLGDLSVDRPIFFHCEPVGATATLIAEQFGAHGVTPPRAIAGLLMAAILSNTVGLRSSTTTAKDRAMVARLAQLVQLDPTAFGDQLLAIKVADAGRLHARAVVRRDFKAFTFGEHRVGISQIHVNQPEALVARKAELMREMRAYQEELGLDQLILMITDVEAASSELWFVGDDPEGVAHAFGAPDDDAAVHLPGTMSRKQQIVPRLAAILGQLQRPERAETGATAAAIHGHG